MKDFSPIQIIFISRLQAIISKIHLEIQSFDSISFFHVLRDNNEVDSFANQAIRLQEGVLSIDGVHSLQFIQ